MRRRLWRRSSGWLILLLAHICCRAAGVSAQTQSAREYDVKAAFLYNFAKFVDWPPGALGPEGTPLAICVLGADPFGAAIDQAVTGKTAHDHPLIVRRIQSLAEAPTCHILFVGADVMQRLGELLTILGNANVLTVGDSDHFAERGGVINMMTEDNRVRFEINAAAADRAGLQVSSQLLKLAIRVIGAPKVS